MLEEADRMMSKGNNKEEKFAALRRFNNRENVRIGLRDLSRFANLVETTENLSDLADVTLQKAQEICLEELTSKFGSPIEKKEGGEGVQATFAIIGLGKFGGKELNFSSDIDIMYVYSSSEGETRGVPNYAGAIKNTISNHEFFCKLAQDISSSVGEVGKDGLLYRVDLRLRPEGKSGNPAMSLRSYEVYYEAWGENWERQMLVKARIVAGDKELGAQWLKMIKPFIYRRTLDYNTISEIRAVKERINKSLVTKKKNENNVKLGYGGIREIEFITQVFQLIYAGKFQWLIERNTLRAIHRIAEKDFLTIDEYAQLSRAYIFHRELENRIQIAKGFQTYTIPKSNDERIALAKKMGYLYTNTPVEDLFKDYNKHTVNVRKVYDSLFYDEKEKHEEIELWDFGENFYEEHIHQLEEMNFDNPEVIYKHLFAIYEGTGSTTNQTAHSKFLFRKLAVIIIETLKNYDNQDICLVRFNTFINNFNNNEALYDFLLQNRPILDALLLVLSRSYFFAKIILSHVEFFYEIRLLKDISAAIQEQINTLDNESFSLEECRRLKRVIDLNCGLKCLSDESYDPGKDLSTFARFFLRKLYEFGRGQLVEKYGEPRKSNGEKALFGIYGLGKLGVDELDFASDLDLIFVYDENGTTDGREQITNHEFFAKLQQIIFESTISTGKSGFAYKVDLRLRPFGKIGAMVDSFENYQHYFNNRAEVWEKLVYTKLGFAAGDSEIHGKFSKIVESFIFSTQFSEEERRELSKQVLYMRNRMETERAKEKKEIKDIKLGFGGIADIDFVIQYLTLCHGTTDGSLRFISPHEALHAFVTKGFIREDEGEILKNAYTFYRKLLREIRIESDTDGTRFSLTKHFNKQIANRFGFKEPDALIDFYTKTTHEVRNVMVFIIKTEHNQS
ncbi:MAG: hypothetical protein HQK84_03610 [Nitrospinae bacterium]|nr:hypothetical protein [Nitrospinota bacterium]